MQAGAAVSHFAAALAGTLPGLPSGKGNTMETSAYTIHLWSVSRGKIRKRLHYQTLGLAIRRALQHSCKMDVREVTVTVTASLGMTERVGMARKGVWHEGWEGVRKTS